jgi:hypothetical protein
MNINGGYVLGVLVGLALGAGIFFTLVRVAATW